MSWIDHRALTPEEALALFERHGAVLSGHFELTSGRHSDRYVQKARVLEQPETAMRLAREIASWYHRVAVALAAGARSIFAEREEGRMRLRRGFSLEPGERALVVEDVVTTGGSAGEVYEVAGRLGAERLGVAALVDRSTGSLPFPLRALVRVEAMTWERGECPLCAQGVPLHAPGSRHLIDGSDRGR